MNLKFPAKFSSYLIQLKRLLTSSASVLADFQMRTSLKEPANSFKMFSSPRVTVHRLCQQRLAFRLSTSSNFTLLEKVDGLKILSGKLQSATSGSMSILRYQPLTYSSLMKIQVICCHSEVSSGLLPISYERILFSSAQLPNGAHLRVPSSTYMSIALFPPWSSIPNKKVR